MNTRKLFGVIFAGLALTAMAVQPAQAHVLGAGGGGLGEGFVHPFGGLDHVLAMVAIGIWAAHLGGLARWLVPASFVAMMAAGGGVALAGIAVPFVEAGITLSVIVLGGLIWARARLPVAFGMALAGGFALFHGAAHGLAAPMAGAGYGLGFVAATALLHLAGLGLGAAVIGGDGGLSRRFARAGGGAMVAAGLVLTVL